MNEDNKNAQVPHYVGHRSRLREKFIKAQDSLADYEILELLLGYAIPRKDVKPLAKEMLVRFKNFGSVLEADMGELMAFDGVKENTAVFLKLIKETHVRSLKANVIKKTVLRSWDAIIDFCRVKIGRSKEEVLYLLWLNKQLELIEMEEHLKGTVDFAYVYPAEIVKRALGLRASYLILVHNHPTGKLKPSPEDIDTTNDIRNALFTVGISLFDHIIIGAEGHYSFKDKGIL